MNGRIRYDGYNKEGNEEGRREKGGEENLEVGCKEEGRRKKSCQKGDEVEVVDRGRPPGLPFVQC